MTTPEEQAAEVLEHVERVAESLREPGDWQYSEPLFRRRLSESVGLDWHTLPANEQIAYVSLLGSAVQTCDDVECDPVGTARLALDAIRPLIERLEAAEADRDKYLAAFSERFDQCEEYATECKRLWRMEERVEALADEWDATARRCRERDGTLCCPTCVGREVAAHNLRAALSDPQPADEPGGNDAAPLLAAIRELEGDER